MPMKELVAMGSNSDDEWQDWPIAEIKGEQTISVHSNLLGPQSEFSKATVRQEPAGAIFRRLKAPRELLMEGEHVQAKRWHEKLGAKVVSHGRYVAFQMAEVAIPRQMFQEISAAHRGTAAAATTSASVRRSMGRAFKANKPEECVPMSGKIAR